MEAYQAYVKAARIETELRIKFHNEPNVELEKAYQAVKMIRIHCSCRRGKVLINLERFAKWTN